MQFKSYYLKSKLPSEISVFSSQPVCLENSISYFKIYIKIPHNVNGDGYLPIAEARFNFKLTFWCP